MHSQIRLAAEIQVAIGYYENQTKKVKIVMEKGGRKEKMDWENHRKLPSLQTVLGKIWFITDPRTFFMPGILLKEVKYAKFDHKKGTLEMRLYGGTITLIEKQRVYRN